jgi:predicted enzyme related to lactoylglutathione lyase
MPNPFVHVELQTHDLPKAKEFYTRLFGWNLQEIGMPDSTETYTMIDVGDGTGGGMFTNPDPDVPPCWLAYVGVDDVRAMTDRARELGADIRVEVMEIGTYGLMSVFIDPTGATLALWQATNRTQQS